MSYIRLLSVIALLLLANPLLAQQKFTISGTIKDKKTGEDIIGAAVRVAEQPQVATVTNEYGFYSLTMSAGTYTLKVSYVGYQEQEEKITLDKNTEHNISLSIAGKELNEVTVSGKSKDANVRSAQMGMTQINIKDISTIPVLFGEKDVMKTVQLLPGVKPAGDGNAGFYVRGGAADQNLILLDEATVYNPSHLLGFFSTFNSDAIKNVTMYKGNEPAQYGGRLASVLDVKMNDGNNQDYHVSGGIGLISSKINIEGPIVKDESSFLISARRTYADVFLKLSNNPTVNSSSLYFYDLNTKINYKISDKDRLYLSGYFGQDALGFSNVFGLNWGNATGTLRWNHIINPRLFSNTSLIYSDYKYNININTSGIDASILSKIQDWNLKEEVSFFPKPKNSIRFGINSIYHTILPGEYAGNITVPSQPSTHTWENALFVSNSWKASSRINVDYGLRISAFSVIAGDNKFYDLDANHNIVDTLKYTSGQIVKTYVNPEPRLSASYLLNEVSSIKVAYARNSQYLHLISNSTTSNPTDKWIATNNIIKPELSDEVSLGYFRNFKDNGYEFSAETYYKNLQNQVDYKDNANLLSNDPIEPQLLFGQGRAYGLELLFRKNVGRFTGWVAYTLSRTEVQINGINNNNWYAARQDRTHDLSVVGTYKLSKKWTISADFVYYTGSAVTFPSGKYNVAGQTVFYYTERNGYRTPAYNRLDFSATKQLKVHKHYSSELVYSLYNVYGRQNPYIITFDQSTTNPQQTVATQTALFRWVPSISYNFKF